MLGAYHAPQLGQPARTTGVLLCSPLGWEGIASQRSYRVLANRLSALGFPVLRFDYPGTGDAQGGELDSALVPAWLNSIELAASELKRLSGVTTVSAVGIHIGATLAAIAAARSQTFSSIVMWAPFAAGKAYVRQVRAYNLLNHPELPPAADGAAEAAGFILTTETMDALSKLDLARAPMACSKALLLARDESSPDEKLATTLRAHGTDVTFERVAGYASLMLEPRKSVVPTLAFDRICSWLCAQHPDVTPVAPVSALPVSAVLELGKGVREEALFFGQSERMFGILTQPATPDAKRPMVVWLNTASDHRTGPNRTYVVLARKLAEQGFSSFRFDPSGVGDAEESAEAPHAYSEARLNDVRETLDWLTQQRDAQRFVLVGVCSAAYVAFHIGRRDPRVVGEILINPQTLVWTEGDSLDLAIKTSFRSNRDYIKRMFELRSWRRGVDFRGIATKMAERVARRVTRKVRRLLPERPGAPLDIARAFSDKLQRKVDVLMIYSGMDVGLDYIEMHLGNGAKELKRFKQFQLLVLPGTDHTFSWRQAKEQLDTLLCTHMVKRFA